MRSNPFDMHMNLCPLIKLWINEIPLMDETIKSLDGDVTSTRVTQIRATNDGVTPR